MEKPLRLKHPATCADCGARLSRGTLAIMRTRFRGSYDIICLGGKTDSKSEHKDVVK
jgi:hypothetical protein